MSDSSVPKSKGEDLSEEILQLPTEIIIQIVRKVAESKDIKSLGRLQRTSRQTYLIATPLLYSELGASLPAIYRQLDGLRILFSSPTLQTIEKIDTGEQNPIDCNLSTRLVWMFSHVERLFFRPHRGDEMDREQSKNLLSHVERLQERKVTVMGRGSRLFPSLEHIDLDLSYMKHPHVAAPKHILPMLQHAAQREMTRPLSSAPRSSLETYVDTVLELFIWHAPLTHACVTVGDSCEELPTYLLELLGCQSLTYHDVLGLSRLVVLPKANRMVLHFQQSAPALLRLGVFEHSSHNWRMWTYNKIPPEILISRTPFVQLPGPRTEVLQWGAHRWCEDGYRDEDASGSDEDEGSDTYSRPGEGDPGQRMVGENKKVRRSNFELELDQIIRHVVWGEIRGTGKQVDMKWGYVDTEESVQGCGQCTELYADIAKPRLEQQTIASICTNIETMRANS